MTPSINVGDLVFIKETDSINDYKTGDIIAFYTNINATEEDEVVVHYLAQITTDQDGVKTFKSKPEVSDDLDSWTLEESDLIGIYDFKISGIGNALMFFKTIPGMVLLIINVWLIFYVIDVFKKNNK
jgi:signal peptidase